MSRKKLLDAIGSIDEKYIDEYASYQPKSKIIRWMPYEIVAACAVLMLAVGIWMLRDGGDAKLPEADPAGITAAGRASERPDQTSQPYSGSEDPDTTQEPDTPPTWPPQIFHDNTGNENETGNIFDEWRARNPGAGVADEEESVFGLFQGAGSLIMGSRSDSSSGNDWRDSVLPGTGNADSAKNTEKEPQASAASKPGGQPTKQPVGTTAPNPTKQPARTAAPDPTKQPTATPQPTVPSTPSPQPGEQIYWTVVTAQREPYEGVIDRLMDEAKATKEPQTTINPEGNPGSEAPSFSESPYEPVSPSAAPSPGSDTDDIPNEHGKTAQKLRERWVTCDADTAQRYEETALLERYDSIETASKLYLYLTRAGVGTYYIAEEQTQAGSLSNANALSREDMFADNLEEHMFCGVSMYFVKDKEDNCYIRFLYKGVLVTLWGEGPTDEQMLWLVKNMLNYS